MACRNAVGGRSRPHHVSGPHRGRLLPVRTSDRTRGRPGSAVRRLPAPQGDDRRSGPHVSGTALASAHRGLGDQATMTRDRAASFKARLLGRVNATGGEVRDPARVISLRTLPLSSRRIRGAAPMHPQGHQPPDVVDGQSVASHPGGRSPGFRWKRCSGRARFIQWSDAVWNRERRRLDSWKWRAERKGRGGKLRPAVRDCQLAQLTVRLPAMASRSWLKATATRFVGHSWIISRHWSTAYRRAILRFRKIGQ